MLKYLLIVAAVTLPALMTLPARAAPNETSTISLNAYYRDAELMFRAEYYGVELKGAYAHRLIIRGTSMRPDMSLPVYYDGIEFAKIYFDKTGEGLLMMSGSSGPGPDMTALPRMRSGGIIRVGHARAIFR